jgi:glycosyltransferase involved in cell wall biosynthesis
MTPSISLIIPAYNEANYLPQLLDTVDEARRCYTSGFHAIEVIVADNASTDETANVARSRGARVVHVEKRAIAAARNGGARIAQSDILAFVDADSQLHPETFNEIERVMSSDKVIVGATGVHVERMSLGVAVAVMIMTPILYIQGLDTGVVFCRKEDWEAVGGYDEEQLVSEDVRFLFALKRRGRKRGQNFIRAKDVKAITSSRKFDKHGDWHFLLGMFRAPLLFLFAPKAFKRYVQKYWYEDR